MQNHSPRTDFLLRIRSIELDANACELISRLPAEVIALPESSALLQLYHAVKEENAIISTWFLTKVRQELEDLIKHQ